MRERIKNLVRRTLTEGTVTANQLKRLEDELDRLFAVVGIDVNFTRHFIDRVNDARNGKEITIEELRYIFKQVYSKYKEQLLNFRGGFEGVFKNPPTDINIPFALSWDSKNNELDLHAKTIMRKKGFKTSNQVLTVENGSSDEITLYHGSPKKITKFVDSFVGGENATDQEGPGIYFTNSYEDAQGYGEYIYKVKITPNRLLTRDEPASNANKEELIKLVKLKDEWEMNAQDWDYDPEVGVRKCVDSAIEYNDNKKDVYLQIWIDFYRYEEVDFVRNMVKLGYDGIKVTGYHSDSNITHYILYNPNIIKVIDQEFKKQE